MSPKQNIHKEKQTWAALQAEAGQGRPGQEAWQRTWAGVCCGKTVCSLQKGKAPPQR